MAKTYHVDADDGYTVTRAIWRREGANAAEGPRGSHFAMQSGGAQGRDMELTTFDADADAKFRAECEAQGIDYRRDWT